MSAIAGGEVAFDLTTVDEFSMYRYIHTEMLDLDYLSPTEPMLANRDVQEAAPPVNDGTTSLVPSDSGFDCGWSGMFSRP